MNIQNAVIDELAARGVVHEGNKAGQIRIHRSQASNAVHLCAVSPTAKEKALFAVTIFVSDKDKQMSPKDAIPYHVDLALEEWNRIEPSYALPTLPRRLAA